MMVNLIKVAQNDILWIGNPAKMVMKDFDIGLHDNMLCIDTKAGVVQKVWYRKLSIFVNNKS